jgi:carbamate kinase
VKTAIVAIGGNALVTDAEHGSIADQFAATRSIARSVVAMIAEGWSVVITHGNGPQVGFILRRSDLVSSLAPEIPRIGLEIAGADSQGGIGHIVGITLAGALRRAGLERPVAAVVTHTVVDPQDPAFAAPSKPIGAWYGAEQAAELQRTDRWTMVEDSGRGWRRVVASPRPLRILELDAIRQLVAGGSLVVAAGGGGIPVVDEGGDYRGVEAVVDKDFASALLAAGLGVDLLVMTTGVPQVAVDFGRPAQRWLDRVTVPELEAYEAEGQFPAGSMGPKIAAALQFLRAGGREVLITSPERLADAIAGRTGTRLTIG